MTPMHFLMSMTQNFVESSTNTLPRRRRTLLCYRMLHGSHIHFVREAKQKRRQSERKWMKSGLHVHKEIYQALCTEYNELLYHAKTEYISSKINITDQRSLYRMVKSLSCPSSSMAPVLPHHHSPGQLANDIAKFFDRNRNNCHADGQVYEDLSLQLGNVPPQCLSSTTSQKKLYQTHSRQLPRPCQHSILFLHHC